MAVARLSGWAKIGTPLCPTWVLYINPGATRCTVNASGADDLSLTTGKGTLSGAFAVVVQGDNLVDAEEFVIMTGTFTGDADLSLAFTGKPLGFITNGVATLDGYAGSSFAFRDVPPAVHARDDGQVGQGGKRTAAPCISAIAGTRSVCGGTRSRSAFRRCASISSSIRPPGRCSTPTWLTTTTTSRTR